MLSKIITITLIFFFIYGPDIFIIPINTATLIGVISCIILFFKYRELCKNYISDNVFIFILLLFLIVYGFCIQYVNNISLTTNSQSILNIRIAIEVIAPSILLAILVNENKINVDDFSKYIIMVASVQIVFIILMLDYELKRTIFVNVLKFNDEHILLQDSEFYVRGFGLAKNYLFTFPLVQGCIAGLSLFLYRDTNKIYFLILFLIVLVSVIFNARIGFLPILFSLIFMVTTPKIDEKVNLRKLFYIFLFSLVLLAFILYSYPTLEKNETFRLAIDRAFDAYIATSTLIFGGSDYTGGVYHQLFNNHLVLPTTFLELLFGMGVTEVSSEYRSDIGFIRMIFYGGFLYSFILYLLYVGLFVKLYLLVRKLNSNIMYNRYVIVLFLSFFIANIKGELFSVNDAVRYLFLLYSVIYIKHRYIVRNEVHCE